MTVGYVIGHAIQNLARSKVIRLITSWLISFPGCRTTVTNGQSLKGRHYAIAFSPVLADEFYRVFEEFYGIDARKLKNDEVFYLVFGPIADRMGTRSVFVAIANFHRAIVCVGVLYFAFLSLKMLYFILSPWWVVYVWESLVLLLLVGATTVIMSKAIDYFKKMTDEIPFVTFLSWYKEKKMN